MKIIELASTTETFQFGAAFLNEMNLN